MAVEDAQQSGGGGAERSVALIDDGTGIAIVRAPPSIVKWIWHTSDCQRPIDHLQHTHLGRVRLANLA